jgi:hypothetical protein
LTAKKAVTGVKASRPAASAQPPMPTAFAVDCTSAFARWTFFRSTRAGSSAPYAGSK